MTRVRTARGLASRARRNNLFFLKPTVVVGNPRKIDGPLFNFLRDADPKALKAAGE